MCVRGLILLAMLLVAALTGCGGPPSTTGGEASSTVANANRAFTDAAPTEAIERQERVPAWSWTGATIGAPSRVALLVTADSYANGRPAWQLPAAAKSGDELAARFKSLGFDSVVVLSGKDTHAENIRLNIAKLADAVTATGSLIVFGYIGHGFTGPNGEPRYFTHFTDDIGGPDSSDATRFSPTFSRADVAAWFAALKAKLTSEVKAAIKIVLFYDACRVKLGMAPGRDPVVEGQIADAEMFSCQGGGYAEILPEERMTRFCASLTDSVAQLRSGDSISLSGLFDLTLQKLAPSKQRPELRGDRDIVIYSRASLVFALECIDSRRGDRIEAVATLQEQAPVSTPHVFAGLRAGRYRIQIKAKGYFPRVEEIDLTTGVSRRTLQVPLVPAYVRVLGQIEPPAAGRRISVEPELPGFREDVHDRYVFSDDAGRFEIRTPLELNDAGLVVLQSGRELQRIQMNGRRAEYDGDATNTERIRPPILRLGTIHVAPSESAPDADATLVKTLRQPLVSPSLARADRPNIDFAALEADPFDDVPIEFAATDPLRTVFEAARKDYAAQRDAQALRRLDSINGQLQIDSPNDPRLEAVRGLCEKIELKGAISNVATDAAPTAIKDLLKFGDRHPRVRVLADAAATRILETALDNNSPSHAECVALHATIDGFHNDAIRDYLRKRLFEVVLNQLNGLPSSTPFDTRWQHVVALGAIGGAPFADAVAATRQNECVAELNRRLSAGSLREAHQLCVAHRGTVPALRPLVIPLAVKIANELSAAGQYEECVKWLNSAAPETQADRESIRFALVDSWKRWLGVAAAAVRRGDGWQHSEAVATLAERTAPANPEIAELVAEIKREAVPPECRDLLGSADAAYHHEGELERACDLYLQAYRAGANEHYRGRIAAELAQLLPQLWRKHYLIAADAEGAGNLGLAIRSYVICAAIDAKIVQDSLARLCNENDPAIAKQARDAMEALAQWQRQLQSVERLDLDDARDRLRKYFDANPDGPFAASAAVRIYELTRFQSLFARIGAAANDVQLAHDVVVEFDRLIEKFPKYRTQLEPKITPLRRLVVIHYGVPSFLEYVAQNAADLPVFRRRRDGMTVVRIPSVNRAPSSGFNPSEVTANWPADGVREFFIDCKEVSHQQYAAFLEWLQNAPEDQRRRVVGDSPVADFTPKYDSVEAWRTPEWPIVGVTRAMALGYSSWANEANAGLSNALPLPRMFEWAVAACWNPGTRQWQANPWGDGAASPNMANCARAVDWPVAVDALPQSASPAGPLHLIGNAWEWTLSPGLACGSSWFDADSKRLLTGLGADDYGKHIGFRCAYRSR